MNTTTPEIKLVKPMVLWEGTADWWNDISRAYEKRLMRVVRSSGRVVFPEVSLRVDGMEQPQWEITRDFPSDFLEQVGDMLAAKQIAT